VSKKPGSDYWFASKSHGWGWGIPLKPQGWVVLGSYLLLMSGLSLWAGFKGELSSGELVFFAVSTVVLSVSLIGVCIKKGEPTKWRWGKKDETR
jgi:hypothetical protein